ncbi:SlyX family protein [Aromatoleum toluclasticum]|nr:SlyX family protein [Aromatoleum toluclasticum]MCC4117299.1 SlyX family protein [Aromatoleum toluclasticum]
MEERLDRIESKLAFAEDAIDELNMTVFRQQQLIDRLQKQIVDLHRQMSAGSPGERRDLREEIPPHY